VREARSGRGDTLPKDLEHALQNLRQVAVWTARHGHLQEHASFLLGTTDDEWHHVPFTDPAATELVARLRTLPGFDTDRLLELLGEREQRVVTIWRHRRSD
jgi:hypothetical protein